MADKELLPAKTITTCEFNMEIRYEDSIETYENLSFNIDTADYVEKKLARSELVSAVFAGDAAGAKGTFVPPYTRLAGEEPVLSVDLKFISDRTVTGFPRFPASGRKRNIPILPWTEKLAGPENPGMEFYVKLGTAYFTKRKTGPPDVIVLKPNQGVQRIVASVGFLKRKVQVQGCGLAHKVFTASRDAEADTLDKKAGIFCKAV